MLVGSLWRFPVILVTVVDINYIWRQETSVCITNTNIREKKNRISTRPSAVSFNWKTPKQPRCLFCCPLLLGWEEEKVTKAGGPRQTPAPRYWSTTIRLTAGQTNSKLPTRKQGTRQSTTAFSTVVAVLKVEGNGQQVLKWLSHHSRVPVQGQTSKNPASEGCVLSIFGEEMVTLQARQPKNLPTELRVLLDLSVNIARSDLCKNLKPK